MKKTYKNMIILVILIILLLLCLLNSEFIILEFLDYSKLFFTKIFPVSFLFFLLSSLIIDYGVIDLFKRYMPFVNSSFYILFISMLSGFPSGAKYSRELLEKKLISRDSANNNLLFTHFPNPLFVLGTISEILNSKILAIKIFISILFSNIILFILLKKEEDYCFTSSSVNNFSSVLTNNIFSTFHTIGIIYGTSIFFYLIIAFILHYFSFNPLFFVLLNGCFDLTKGVFSTTILSNQFLSALFILIFISFGGISIHMQVKAIISNSSLKYSYFLFGRIVSTLFAICIFVVLFLIF